MACHARIGSSLAMLYHTHHAAPFLNSLGFLIPVVRLPAAKIGRSANASMAAMAEERFRSLAIVHQDKPFIPEEGHEDDIGTWEGGCRSKCRAFPCRSVGQL